MKIYSYSNGGSETDIIIEGDRERLVGLTCKSFMILFGTFGVNGSMEYTSSLSNLSLLSSKSVIRIILCRIGKIKMEFLY